MSSSEEKENLETERRMLLLKLDECLHWNNSSIVWTCIAFHLSDFITPWEMSTLLW
jgi:hypothetical protein